MGNTSITRLTDRELLARVEELTRTERKLTLAVIDHLTEVERRRFYAERGHRSLFAYCTDEHRDVPIRVRATPPVIGEDTGYALAGPRQG